LFVCNVMRYSNYSEVRKYVSTQHNTLIEFFFTTEITLRMQRFFNCLFTNCNLCLSRLWFPMVSSEFCNGIILPTALWP